MDSPNKSYEPMDIDLSSHSNNAMDISYNKSNTEMMTPIKDETYYMTTPAPPQTPVDSADTTEHNVTNQNPLDDDDIKQPTFIKKFHIIRQTKSTTNTHHLFKIKIIFSVVILCLSLITYHVLNIQCSDHINSDKLKSILSAKLYGQSRAIETLIEALNVRERSKILFFYGGTGVGKTFTVSVILDYLGYYSNVYHYTMPSFMTTFTTEFMIGLTVCKHTTIIVDDLSVRDVNVKTHINEVIKKSQNLDKDITIILVYNCDTAENDFERKCDESFPNKLLQYFNDINAFKKLIKFELLREEHLRMCVETEMGNRKLSDVQFEKLLKNFNVTLDGCKGVYTKIKLLEIY